MNSLLANHLWQSTVFAAAAGLLTLAFRNHRAQTRYASLAGSFYEIFLIPFFLLMAAGNRIHWSGSTAVQQVVPVSQSKRSANHSSRRLSPFA